MMYFVVALMSLLVGISACRYRVYLLQNEGEALVSRVLLDNLPVSEYHLLNNVTLPVKSGTTQIDHIVVSRYGVFIIETKHYSGWIFANEHSPTWTQTLYMYKSKFLNPLRQNYGHVKAVQALLDFVPREYIKSVVVFTGDAVFKTDRPAGVFELEEISDFILGFRDEVLTENRRQFCVGRLECQRLALTKETDVIHRASLQKRFGNQD